MRIEVRLIVVALLMLAFSLTFAVEGCLAA